jgi:hypothetical protein
MFGNTQGLETAFKLEARLREQAKEIFSKVPSKNLVQILQNYETMPGYRHLIMPVNRLYTRVKYKKEYGSFKHLTSEPNEFYPNDRERGVILNILEERL